ncbi:MAG: hypothetical protein ACXU91_16370 [Gemmatimonadaceae bacterium]
MSRSNALLFAAGLFVVACHHRAPVASRVQVEHPVLLVENGTPPPAGMRLAIQFDNEPPIIQVSDGKGGPPILYHGRELNPSQIKSIVVLRGKEARERFGDRKLDAAILIGLK